MFTITRGAAAATVAAALFVVPAIAQTPASVTVENLAFHPPELTVSAGTAVQWTNRDGTQHQVESDDGSVVGPVMGTGEMFSFTFRTPGRLTYHCGIHPSMTGAIVIQ